jgi:hypothetical protein
MTGRGGQGRSAALLPAAARRYQPIVVEPPSADPSRRRLIRVALGAAVATAAAPAATAQKVSQAEARYQDQPKSGLSCSACALFRPPAACAIVAGVISPHGWCRFFDLPD